MPGTEEQSNVVLKSVYFKNENVNLEIHTSSTNIKIESRREFDNICLISFVPVKNIT